MSANALELNNVSHRFGARWVLRQVSVQVAMGESVLLTGDNGAGKTTLMRIMAALLKPLRGDLRWFGASAELGTHVARIGFLSHAHQLYEGVTASDNLQIFGRYLGISLNEAQRRHLLQQVGLAAHAQRNVATFSAGMKRRLALAVLDLKQPDLLFLDEPFGQLDQQGVALMEEKIRSYQQRGAALVVSTHDWARGQALCQRHWHVESGRVEERKSEAA